MDIEWEQEALCCVCMELYKDPVILDCGHNLCKVCAVQVMKFQHMVGKMSCPQCRSITNLPNGVDGLKDNFTLRNIVDNLKQHLQKTKKQLTLCGNCEEGDAAYDCEECGFPLCEECRVNQHSKGGYKKHTLQEFNPQNPRKIKAKSCSEHNKELDLYDSKRDELLCVYCLQLSKNTEGHFKDVIPLSQAISEAKEILFDNLKKVDAKIGNVNKEKDSLKESQCRIRDECTKHVSQVNTYFKSLTDLLNAKERQCIDELNATATDRISAAAESEKELTNTLEHMTSTHEKFSSVVSHTHNADILKAKSIMLSRLKTLTSYSPPVVSVALPTMPKLPPSLKFDSLVAEIGISKQSPQKLSVFIPRMDIATTPIKHKQSDIEGAEEGNEWDVPTVKKPRRSASSSGSTSKLTLRI